jgi:acyl-[acyl-carrier-protein]-phospholipid O-acyltransferase/long-chain-fatty-acid--[acyl-carrier-protein] ligase
MISLEVVEKLALQAAPGGAHAATTQTDSARGEAIVLFTEDRSLTRDMLVAAAGRLGVPEIAVPRKIAPVDSLPLLATGKTDYVMLKRLAETA